MENNELMLYDETPETMTTLEIAEITGVEHKHVLRAVRLCEKELEEMLAVHNGPSNIQSVHNGPIKIQSAHNGPIKIQSAHNGPIKYIDSRGKQQPMYILNKVQAL